MDRTLFIVIYGPSMDKSNRMDPALVERYGNRVRVRACGLCWWDKRLLLVNHRGLANGDFWAPPGGGLEFGETVQDRVITEFLEETGLHVSVERFLFACEFIRDPLHAIELFFEVKATTHEITAVNDPIVQDARFMSEAEIAAIPDVHRHGIFQLIPSPGDLNTLTGFFRL